jgi:Asp-tRNA(Asn)/Glu-tRNA(Gln) amidotransferase B subunit
MTLTELIESLKKKHTLSYKQGNALVHLMKLRSEISSYRFLEEPSILTMEASPSIPESEQEKS